MTPNEIYELASALSVEFGIEGFDEAVDAAWRIHRELEASGVTISTVDLP